MSNVSIMSRKPASGEPAILLRIQDVAHLLQLSRSKAYVLVKSGELPSVKIGKNVRVPRLALGRWLDGLGVPPADVVTGHATPPPLTAKQLLVDAGFDQLGSRFSVHDAEPVLRRVAKLLKGRTPLEKSIVREECIERLTKARVRTPVRTVDLALQ